MREWLDFGRLVAWEWNGVKFIGDLQINREGEKDGCCVLCDRDYYESYVLVLMDYLILFTDVCLNLSLTFILATYDAT